MALRHLTKPRDLVLALGFAPIDGDTDVYGKSYSQHDGYTVRVDVGNERIEYVDGTADKDVRITVGDGTTSNFAHPENFVVLECVIRLMDKGYPPRAIELEKVYPSGRGHSGRLDILVNDSDGNPFLMIECKTWGTEYNKEREKMLKDGGQLFTYYKNATATSHLCLYASRLVGSNIEYVNSIVDVQKEWMGLSETKDIYEYWNKIFKDNGIFENYATPYNIVHKRLTYGMLQNMKVDDSGKIYNHIMEILRHNGISDKPNAFNKLLNLFVCKIIDEDKNPDDELMFQCWHGLSDEKLQMTLNDLYKEGMWRFLEICVIDHSESDVNKVLQDIGVENTVHKQKIIDMFIETRLKKSPNFAFVEVQDEKTFRLNAKIVREIVELLQPYKFRYEQKHEFLGNFFEKMLNTSMKQEAGQFFTPVPITRFIISCLPLREFVQKRIDGKETDPLPTVIDYACGSGHFLTEFMSKMQTIIEDMDVSKAPPGVRGKLNSWCGDVKFSWANEYVYGIDFDNRLVKTTKVSAFFNGDGAATIVWGNGLDNFEYSDEYRYKLAKTLPNKRDNGQFDILISNPPYSVQAFKTMLKHGVESFDLYSSLTDNSSEIECLFVERMKQLLKVGGWAGIILPSSMLSNGGIYSRTREIIFKYFKVKSIVELGSGTFMKTGTNTIILFLERRADNDHEKIAQAISKFFKDGLDVTVAGIERAFSKYVANAYDDLTFDDYVTFANGAANDTMKSYELWLDYVRDYGENPYEKALVVECEKIMYFLLTHDQNIVVVKSGQKQDEKAFLGYEFSERRGYEGIKFLPAGTKLFDEANDSLNPQKINSYIYNAFLGNPTSEVDKAVVQHVSHGRMSSFFDYGTRKFDKRVNLSKKAKFISEYPLFRLRDCVSVSGGLWTGKKPPFVTVRVIRNTDFTLNGTLIPNNIAEIDVEKSAFEPRKLKFGDIILEKSGGSVAQAVGRVVKFDIKDGDYSFSNFTACLRVNRDDVEPNYLYHILHRFYTLGGTFSLQKNGKSQLKNLDIEGYLDTKIPIPPIDIQRQIVAEFDAMEHEETRIYTQLVATKERLTILVKNSGYTDTKLSTFAGYVAERIGISTLSPSNYVGVDNLLQNVKGRTDSSHIPTSGKVTAYCEGDILLSNIRPYLKKAWLADRKGGCSNDVLAIRVDASKALPKYVFCHLSSDDFFAYEMEHIGSNVKMPRADKTKILDYKMPLPSLKKQKEIVTAVEKQETEIARLRERLDQLKIAKSTILDKYL